MHGRPAVVVHTHAHQTGLDMATVMATNSNQHRLEQQLAAAVGKNQQPAINSIWEQQSLAARSSGGGHQQ